MLAHTKGAQSESWLYRITGLRDDAIMEKNSTAELVGSVVLVKSPETAGSVIVTASIVAQRLRVREQRRHHVAVDLAAEVALVDGLRARGHRQVIPLEDRDALARTVSEIANAGDLVVCLGAGNITQWAHALPAEIKAWRRQCTGAAA